MSFLNEMAKEINREFDNMSRRFLYEINEDLGFPKPSRIVFFTNGLKDLDPVKWEKTDFGYKGTLKTLGIEKAKVEICEDGLKVSGKNIVDDNDFGTIMPLPINQDILAKIKEIKHKTVAGVTIVELHLDKPEKRITISELD